jgi:hypothetical protein
MVFQMFLRLQLQALQLTLQRSTTATASSLPV